jgi:hypothetical protein
MYNSRRKLEQHGHGPSSETRGECCEDWEWFFLAGEKPRLSEGFIHILLRPFASLFIKMGELQYYQFLTKQEFHVNLLIEIKGLRLIRTSRVISK